MISSIKIFFSLKSYNLFVMTGILTTPNNMIFYCISSHSLQFLTYAKEAFHY